LFVTSSDTRCLEIFFETKMIPPTKHICFLFVLNQTAPKEPQAMLEAMPLLSLPLVAYFSKFLKNFIYINKRINYKVKYINL
jgi:hypothetical protein